MAANWQGIAASEGEVPLWVKTRVTVVARHVHSTGAPQVADVDCGEPAQF